MWDRLEEEAKTCGLALNMRTQKMRYPSQKALALIMAARENTENGFKGHRQHNLARAISHACYMDGLNIGDDDVLGDIALAHGFEAQEITDILTDAKAIAEVEKGARWAPQAGITGVPYFIFNNKFALSGAQPLSVFEEALKRALSMERVASTSE
jgi:predicted DsbA family dithiol-disulfide isomerase